MAVEDRAGKVLKVENSLIYDMELLCLTGVEDKLQPDVKPTLELLRNAGIKVSLVVVCYRMNEHSPKQKEFSMK